MGSLRRVLLLLAVAAALVDVATAVFVDVNGVTRISLGQVTHESCSNHRNGPALAVAKINALNDGRGFALGFDQGTYVSFNLTSLTISPDIVVSSPEYVVQHQLYIQQLVAAGVDLFIGSCSQGSEAERDMIDAANKILTAQVGPDKFYEDAKLKNQTNVFGAHVSSYRYTFPFLQLAKARGAKSVAIAGRLQSLFFETTCSNARQYALNLDMDVVYFHQYDHSNLFLSQNVTYQRQLALEIAQLQPDVVIGCVGGGLTDEPVVWLDAFHDMRFSPAATWLTSSTWGLPARLETQLNSTDGLYMHGAGQWHQTMTYSDDVVGTTADFKAEYLAMFGEDPSYDAVASYTIVWMYMKAVQQTFSAMVGVTAGQNLLSGGVYDELRRNMVLLREPDSLYGPIAFDRTLQRNVGRSASASQFHRRETVMDEGSVLLDVCIAPLAVATGGLIYPSPGSLQCPQGQMREHKKENCLMCDHCVDCSDGLVYTVSDCNDSSQRVISYSFVAEKQCTTGIMAPPPRTVECEYVPWSSTNGKIVSVLAVVNIVVALLTAACLFLDRLLFGSMWKSLSLLERVVHSLSLVGLIAISIGGLLYLGEPTRVTCEGGVSLTLLGLALFIGALISSMMLQAKDRRSRALKFVVTVPGFLLLLIIILLATSPPDPGTRLSTAHGLVGIPQSGCHWPGAATTIISILLFYAVCSEALAAYTGFEISSSSLSLGRNKKERLKRLLRMTMMLIAASVTAAILYVVMEDDSDTSLLALSILFFVTSFGHYALIALDIAPTLTRRSTSRMIYILFDQDDAERATVIGNYITKSCKVSAANSKRGGFYVGSPGEAANQLMESSLVVYILSETSVSSTRCRDMCYLCDNVSKPLLPVAIASFSKIEKVIDPGVQMITAPYQWLFVKGEEVDDEVMRGLSSSVSKLLDDAEEKDLDEESPSYVAELTYRRASVTFGSADDTIDKNMPKRQNEMDAISKTEHADVFISWAHADKEMVSCIWDAVRAKSIKCWIDFDLQPGHSWRAEIARAIKQCKVMVFVGTDNSMRSKYCYDELLFAKSRGVAILPFIVKNKCQRAKEESRAEVLLSEIGVLEMSGSLVLPEGNPSNDDKFVLEQLVNQIQLSLKVEHEREEQP